nr:alpha-ketoglutarate-dependent dioxygenase AlkB [Haliangium ochraceum]
MDALGAARHAIYSVEMRGKQNELFPEQAPPLPEGFLHIVAALDLDAQGALLEQVRAVLAEAPAYRPSMPRTGAPLSVRMSNCGTLGWISDRAGYRYEPLHPHTARRWPAIPPLAMAQWNRFADWPVRPEACLVNLYQTGSRLGMHVDQDERAADAPVVSISLGCDAVYRLGGHTRNLPSQRLLLRSGDVVVLGGAARRCYHGVDRIVAGTSPLPELEARINLTLRRVEPLDTGA